MDCVLGCARILRSEERLSPLAELLASVGDGAWIEPPFYCDYGWNISLAPGA